DPLPWPKLIADKGDCLLLSDGAGDPPNEPETDRLDRDRRPPGTCPGQTPDQRRRGRSATRDHLRRRRRGRVRLGRVLQGVAPQRLHPEELRPRRAEVPRVVRPRRPEDPARPDRPGRRRRIPPGSGALGTDQETPSGGDSEILRPTGGSPRRD